jgi:flagellar basal-body rod modification protein FlgD
MADAINGVATSSYTGGTTKKTQSTLDMETFMRLLTTQLANQNPLEPMNDRDFFAQMAQLGQVQGLDSVKKSLDVTQAAAPIGKQVTAVSPFTTSSTGSNELIQGTVKQLSVRNGVYYLGVQEANGGISEVTMDNIQQISG